MKLNRIQIEKFRSIKKSDIIVNSLTALVGENNVGKSAILRALNAFFNFDLEKEYFISKRHLFAPRSSSKITLHFEKATSNSSLDDLIAGNLFSVEFKYSYSTNKKKYILFCNGEKKDIKEDFIEELKHHIQFVLIPMDRNYKNLQWNNGTVLKEVVEEYLKQATQKRDTLSIEVKKLTDKIYKTAFKKISKEIEKNYSINHTFKFDIKHKADIGYNILLNDIALQICDMERNHEISDCGSGIQSLTVIAFYRYLANLRHSNYIIGIEEPETNLHPQLQKEFTNSIKEQSKNELQVLLTTHSSIIVDELDHSEIVQFNRKNDDSRGFYTLTTQIRSDFWQHYNLEEFKYYQFYKYRNSDFFFSKFIIIVESKNDAEIVKKILKQLKIDINATGISIINIDGVKNLKYPFYLIKELKIDYLIILDKDFFVPYSHDKLKNSRNNNGFPKYKNEYKTDRMSIIKDLISYTNDRSILLDNFAENHTKALDLLIKYKIICFRYSLEMDLVCSETARNIYYEICDVPQSKKSTQELLCNRHKQIKDISNLIKVISSLPIRNYPTSYTRIRKFLKNRFK